MTTLSRKDRIGYAVIAAVVLGFVGLIFLNYVLSNKGSTDERGCTGSVTYKTAILIDRSDETPLQTIDEIISRTLRAVEADVRENELISIFKITDSAQTSLKPVFVACKPKSDGNELYENRKTIQNKFRDEFLKPLKLALAEPANISESSPLAEVITDLSLSEYLDSEKARLIVFSDMMQNSNNLSLYACQSRQEAVAYFREQRAGALERPSFKNLQVILHVVPREGMARPTVQCRDGFWAWFLGDNEGNDAGVDQKYLPGGATIK